MPSTPLLTAGARVATPSPTPVDLHLLTAMPGSQTRRKLGLTRIDAAWLLCNLVVVFIDRDCGIVFVVTKALMGNSSNQVLSRGP